MTILIAVLMMVPLTVCSILFFKDETDRSTAWLFLIDLGERMWIMIKVCSLIIIIAMFIYGVYTLFNSF